MSSRPGFSLRASEQAFRLLARLYPAGFRREYGTCMQQVFRDECREIIGTGSSARLIQFWLHTLSDFAVALPKEHLTSFHQSMNAVSSRRFFGLPELSFAKLFWTGVLSIVTGVSLVTIFQPRTYQSIARLEVGEAPESSLGYDPYRLQLEFEKMRSEKVLWPVIEQLALEKQFARKSGTRPSRQESLEMLRNMMQLRTSRNTALVELRILSDDPELSAQIANAISESYSLQAELQRTRPFTPVPAPPATMLPLKPVQLIDRASPEWRPIRPNVPLNIVLGTLLSLPLAAMAAWMLRRFRLAAPSPPRLDRNRAGF